MKKLIVLAIVALLGFAAHAADPFKVTVKEAALSTAVTNVVQYTAPAGKVVEVIMFQHIATTANTPVITVIPANGTTSYIVYTGDAVTNSSVTVACGNAGVATSPKIILLPGDVMKITGTAAPWATSKYRVVVRETVQ